MKKSLILLIVFIVESSTNLKSQNQFNFGIKGGMYNYELTGIESGRYNDMDVKISTNYNPNLFGPTYPHFGLFAELPITNLNFLSLNFDLGHMNRFLFITPTDYNPPTGFGSQSGIFTARYNTFMFSILPSLHFKREVSWRIFAGYEAHYFAQKNKTIDGGNSEAYNEWADDNQRRIDVANRFMEVNPHVPFVHHFAAGIEARYWHIGLEMKYLVGLNSPLRNVPFNEDYTYIYFSETKSIWYTLKIYFKNVNR